LREKETQNSSTKLKYS